MLHKVSNKKLKDIVCSTICVSLDYFAPVIMKFPKKKWTPKKNISLSA